MKEELNYGFQIERTSILGKKYEIYDLAIGNKVFDVEVSGSFKPNINIYASDGKDEISAKKTSVWGDMWKIFKKGMNIAELRLTGGICSRDYVIFTGSEEFLATRLWGNSIQINSKSGELVVLIDRRGILNERYLVEVKEDFDPLVALCISIIFCLIIRSEQAVVV